MPHRASTFAAAVTDKITSRWLVGLPQAETAWTLFTAASDVVTEVDDVRHRGVCCGVTRVAQQQSVVVTEHATTAGRVALQAAVFCPDVHPPESLATTLSPDTAPGVESRPRVGDGTSLNCFIVTAESRCQHGRAEFHSLVVLAECTQ